MAALPTALLTMALITIQVHGDGVVGCYPLLRDGGYRDDRQSQYSSAVGEGEECAGIFIYQVSA
jgi:hypothetical protein